MSRYFLNVFNRTGTTMDDEGQELADLTAACAQAMMSVRSILSDEALDGKLDLCGRIEVTDEAAGILAVVPFIDAFELYLPDDE
jgi:hypothetical protein